MQQFDAIGTISGPQRRARQEGKLLDLRSLVNTRATVSLSYRFGLLCGGSRAMKSRYESIERVAPTNTTVLIVGESGSVTEMPIDLQVRPLRVLETGRFFRVGETGSVFAVPPGRDCSTDRYRGFRSFRGNVKI